MSRGISTCKGSFPDGVEVREGTYKQTEGLASCIKVSGAIPAGCEIKESIGISITSFSELAETQGVIYPE